jgi:SH3-like domain-containing protein
MRFRVANTDGQGVHLRSEPSATASLVTALPEGTLVTGDDHAWRAVTDTTGNHGWMASEFLTASDDKFRVANTGGQGANMRAEPGMEARRIAALPDGALVTSEGFAFRHVVDNAGNNGWVAEEFLTAEDQDVWTFALGVACCAENYWDPNGQPHRRAAMEQCNQLPLNRRRAMFERAMDDGLTAEDISDPATRDIWKQAMRTVTLGDGFPGECPDLNPFMLAGEVGGVFRGGADALNSSGLGYFQFIAQKPIPIGTSFSPEFDYGHWRSFSPCPDDYAHQTEPVCQVREFIRAIRQSRKHHGDPMSVVQEKRTPPHIWGP